MEQLNWLPNVKFNSESRFFTTKDVNENAEKIKTADKAIRDIKRKRAIDKAISEGIDSKGELNQEALRQSLKNSGFGEEADTLVNKITADRNAKVVENLELRKKMGESVGMDLVKPDYANRALGEFGPQPTTQNVTTQTPNSSQEQKANSPLAGGPSGGGSGNGAGGFPSVMSPAYPKMGPGLVGDRPVLPTLQTPQNVPQTPSSQTSPDYVKMGPADFSQFASKPSAGSAGVPFTYSNDPLLASYQKEAAGGVIQGLGKNTSEENINSVLEARAESLFPNRSPNSFKDFNEYQAYRQTRDAKKEEYKQKQMQEILNQANTMRNAYYDSVKTETGVKAQKLTEDKSTLPGFSFKSDPNIVLDITKQQTQNNEAIKLANDLSKMKNTDPDYKGTLLSLGKTLIQAKGLGISEGVLENMENQMKGAGFDIGNFIKTNVSTATELGQNFLREYYRAATTGTANFKGMVRTVNRANRDFMFKLGPSDIDSFIEATPIYGETPKEKAEWKKSHMSAKEKIKSKTTNKSSKSSAEGL